MAGEEEREDFIDKLFNFVRQANKESTCVSVGIKCTGEKYDKEIRDEQEAMKKSMVEMMELETQLEETDTCFQAATKKLKQHWDQIFEERKEFESRKWDLERELALKKEAKRNQEKKLGELEEKKRTLELLEAVCRERKKVQDLETRICGNEEMMAGLKRDLIQAQNDAGEKQNIIEELEQELQKEKEMNEGFQNLVNNGLQILRGEPSKEVATPGPSRENEEQEAIKWEANGESLEETEYCISGQNGGDGGEDTELVVGTPSVDNQSTGLKRKRNDEESVSRESPRDGDQIMKPNGIKSRFLKISKDGSKVGPRPSTSRGGGH